MVDFESMGRELSGASSCGDSLDYDPVFTELEIIARGKPEQHFGATLVPAQDPDWRQVEAVCVDLFERTRDLRVAVYLARAETVLEGLPGLTGALELIRTLVSRFWAEVHPQLDPDDDNDPMVRMNALAALADPVGLLRDLRDVRFVSSALGTCNIRDAEAVIGAQHGGSADAAPISPAQLTGLVRAHAAAGGANEAQRAFEATRALAAALIEQVGAHQTIDVDPLLRRLRLLSMFYAEATGEGKPGGTTDDADRAGGDGASRAAADTDDADRSDADDEAEDVADGGKGRGGGRIRTRDDVVRELDRICLWLERHDPANPAPLLIRRAQRLVTMNFLDILRDLAPESLSSIEKIAGLTPSESE